MKTVIVFSLLFLSLTASGAGGDYRKRVHDLAAEKNIPLIQVACRTPEEYTILESSQREDIVASPEALTVFQAASISKVVFSYIVMRMVDRGEIGLDVPLYTYTANRLESRFLNACPGDDAKSRQNEEWARQLTARIILTHGSGLPNWMKNGLPSSEKLVFKCEPDTRYTYSGEGIHYLQRVVEGIKGMSLEEMAKQEVFLPLGMTHSSYRWLPEYEESAAWGYTKAGEKGSQGSALTKKPNAAFSLRTNVVDFSKFLDALVVGKGLKKETFEMMTTACRPTDKPGLYFGLGIRLRPNNGKDCGTRWEHGGSNRNFRCRFWIFPQSKSYLVYFTNSENGAGNVPNRLMEIFFPQYTDIEF
jgi:CubicO group peptidase (beta-lactamase class C family)